VLRGLLGFEERVKHYEAQKVLGCGGFSAVYLAKDLKYDRDVALKELFGLDEEDIKRFEHEAAILRRLSHPQLPRFYEHFEHKGKYYLAMEFIPGQTSHDIVVDKQKGGEKVREVVAFGWALQLCDAVAYLHKEGIIHRDIKPDNVRLTPKGEICLVDLGIAKRVSPEAPSVTVVHGLTQGYAPIEQYATRASKYKGRTDERTDIYAMGATLYTVVTNLIPPDARALVAGTEILPPIQAVHPQISNQFAMTIERAMELMPENRFASVVDMRLAFEGKVVLDPVPPKKESAKAKGSPFLFSDGREARELGEFVSISDQLWEDAKGHLYEGHIEQWDWLPLNAKFGLVTRAREIRENEPNQDMGLDDWLEMAAQVAEVQRKRPQITLSVNPSPPVDFGEIQDWDAEARSIQLQLKLEGSRTRRSVVGCAPCLETSTSQIEWSPDGLAALDVALKPGAGLDIGEHVLPEAVWLETDHQKQTVAARITVKPSIEIVEIEVEPISLDFGRVDPRRPPELTLTVRNPGKESWQGNIETEPWLRVTPNQVKCDAGGEATVKVSLPQKTLEQPGDYHERKAIAIRVGDQVRSVAARLTVLAPAAVTVSPETLDFGKIDSTRCPVLQLRLHYSGESEWQGSITTEVPWLEIRGTAESPSQENVTTIMVAPKPEGLPAPGDYYEEEAITISGEGQVVTVAARLVAVEPSLEFSTALIDFGQVANAKATKPESVKVHNPSLFEWQGKARSTVPWLGIKPARVVCGAGKHTSLKASLTPSLAQLNAGPLHQPSAILVEGMGQEYGVDAQLTFLPPPPGFLEIDPPVVDFGPVSDWMMAKPQPIKLRNRGTQALRLSIDPRLSWLDVQPRVIECPPGDCVEMMVSLSKMAHRLRPAPYLRPEAIAIKGAGDPRYLDVNLEIIRSKRRPKPKTGIEIRPLVIDFGQIGKLKNQVIELKVSNHTRSKWTGLVACKYPWLECTPAVVECPPGRDVIISVRLGRLFTKLPAKEYDRAEAIVIKGKEDDKVFHIRVRLRKIKP